MTSRDVVVIGGGIVGCAVAYFLTLAGKRPLLLERDGIATGTSGSCMGHLMMVPEPEPMYRLTRRSIELWQRLHRDVGGFGLRPCGCLWLAESAADMEFLSTMQHQLTTRQDEAADLLSAADLRTREPGIAADLQGALHYREDAVVFPMQVAGVLLREALRRGAEVWTHAAVQGVRRHDADGSVCGIDTTRGMIATTTVVNAAGVWAPDLTAAAGLGRLPILPRRGELAITLAGEPTIRHQLLEVAYLRRATTDAPAGIGGAMDDRSDPGSVALNVQPQNRGAVLIGSTRQFAGYDTRVNEALLRAALHRAIRFIPTLAARKLVRTWAGLRPYTPDKLPIVGPVAAAPGYFVAGGHEGLGITLSMVTGELISHAITGRPSPLSLGTLAALSPDRFEVVGHV